MTLGALADGQVLVYDSGTGLWGAEHRRAAQAR